MSALPNKHQHQLKQTGILLVLVFHQILFVLAVSVWHTLGQKEVM